MGGTDSEASPRATSCSSANWRIVSSIENRVRPEDWSATSSDLRTKASSKSGVAIVIVGAVTAMRSALRGRILPRTPNTG